MHLAGSQYIAAQHSDQGFQQAAGLVHTGCQRRAVEINAFACIDPTLAVQG